MLIQRHLSDFLENGPKTVCFQVQRTVWLGLGLGFVDETFYNK